jgi:formylglycine-generating enzyme required for sulfatase activity
VRLLANLIDVCDDTTLGLLVVIAECAEILLGRGVRLQSPSEARFRALCLHAVDRNVAIRERWLLGMALGRIGDPRMAVDMHDDTVWVQIPPGEYRIGESRRVVGLQRPFWIARWPVTNGQFARFVDQGGYLPAQPWWSQDGRDWLLAEEAKEPRFWRSGRWNAPNQPVVGVSYWEAEAFSAWAGGHLPRELEWEAAARGPEGHRYPWGDQWEELICNSRETGLNVTSPVGIFPRSRSRTFELEDMAGNVWEWCRDVIGHDDDTPTSQRLLRGCSWHDEPWTARSQNRGALAPHGRLDHI